MTLKQLQKIAKKIDKLQIDNTIVSVEKIGWDLKSGPRSQIQMDSIGFFETFPDADRQDGSQGSQLSSVKLTPTCEVFTIVRKGGRK